MLLMAYFVSNDYRQKLCALNIYREIALTNVRVVSEYEITIFTSGTWFHRSKIQTIRQVIQNLIIAQFKSLQKKE